MKNMDFIKMFGDELEFQAKPLLEKEFDSVEWISKYNPSSPFDFLCRDKEINFYVDVKSCLNGIIYIKKNKFKDLKKGKYPNFYFFLYNGKGFHLISFTKLVQINKYRVIFSKSIFKKTREGGYNGFNFSIPDELHEQFKIESIKKRENMSNILVDLIKEFLKNKRRIKNA